ncbi:hypothetical protein VOLCADRAFT_98253 [Volvox carteri f. nagariensis]|uniref:Uncharacterized protein n=1 Tax=Volvox carteri f. nagariensis TaxID=3068 RepID=D8UEY9_VOLCA|nr:uncharacterized protein VOLCADRAFT_98253 [Volvox carteri f. nagariensis]EFJ41726.1 hypothetical protein VOLCADRAFT_98253 [Volvox carteri f. nagariensis]|eukprot:XP_002957228.1 hypothetical protein VOLCADRAFT_98253 [Volvox carteri f. nagariensis]
MSFNRRGTLLAARADIAPRDMQLVQSKDMLSSGISTHAVWRPSSWDTSKASGGGAVTSVAWSRNGQNMLSGSEDQSIILWDLVTCSKICQLSMRSPILRVSLSPHPPHIAVVSLTEGTPVLVDFTSQQQQLLALAGDGAEPAPSRGGGAGGGGTGNAMLAIFNRQGDMIIGSQIRGAISVVDVASRKILDVVRLPNSGRVVDLVFNRKGNLLLATCTDQRVRMYEMATRGSLADAAVPTEAQLSEALANRAVKSGSVLHGESGLLRPVRDFQNAVERTPWRSATFSCDSEHVAGATAAKAQLQIYIWNRLLGNMEHLLEGPKESALELAWHPLRSLLLSCASSGRIYIWAKPHAENWSAFAPDFKELDENTEYVEREDEFDWNTPGAGGDLGLPGAADGGGGGTGGEGDPGSVVLDVLTRESQPVFSSDDEESSAQELLYLPVIIERELPPGGRPDEGDGEVEGDGGGGDTGEQPSGTMGPTAAGPEGPQAQQALLMQMQQQMGRLAQFPRRNGSSGAGRSGNGSSGGGGGGGRGGPGGPRGSRRDPAGDGGGGAGLGFGAGGGGGGAVKQEQEDWEDFEGGCGLPGGRKRKVQFDEDAPER